MFTTTKKRVLNLLFISTITLSSTSLLFAEVLKNPHDQEPIGTVEQLYDGKLMPDLQANTFRNIDRLYPTAIVQHDPDNIRELPYAAVQVEDLQFQSGDDSFDLYDYININRVAGLIAIKDGKIYYEDYQLGNHDATRWMSMSVVKSITATLIGIALEEGLIKDIDDPIVTYLPDFKESSYDGVTVRQLLQMTSGVAWNETYTDPNSDRRAMLALQNAQEPGAILQLMQQLPRAAEPGTRWNYSTGETHVAGALVRAATGMPVSQYLSERIWKRAGMESDASWWLESPDGLEVGGSGLQAVLRDYARFGLFLLENGNVDGEQLLPEYWLKEAGSPKIVNGETVQYGYMLWPVEEAEGTINEGAFTAEGIFGQQIYINPQEGVVIAAWGAQPKPTGRETLDSYAFFAAMTESMKQLADHPENRSSLSE